MGSELLLVLVHFKPSAEYIDKIRLDNPGMGVLAAQTGYNDGKIPTEVSDDIWAKVTVLLTWGSLPSKEQAPNLRYVQLLSAGCNQIFGKPIFEETDVAFCTSNGVHPPQIAEWVFTIFLGFQHRVWQHYESQKLGKWMDPESDEDTEDAVGLRIGILGYGCIGRQVARVGKAFGMQVLAFTLHERPTLESKKDDSFTEPGLGDPEGQFPSAWYHGTEQLNDFLGADLDLLVITLPLTSLTRGLLSRNQFEVLSKKQAFVCNVGRGPIIDTDSLIEALEQGKIRGAALDVTDPEPLPEAPIMESSKRDYHSTLQRELKSLLRTSAEDLVVQFTTSVTRSSARQQSRQSLEILDLRLAEDDLVTAWLNTESQHSQGRILTSPKSISISETDHMARSPSYCRITICEQQ